MRLPRLLLALIVALPFAAACSESGNGGAGGAAATTGTGSKTVVKAKDAGPKDDAGADPESTSAGW